MSIFNPWGELRALKARLAAEEEAYRIEEAQQQAEALYGGEHHDEPAVEEVVEEEEEEAADADRDTGAHAGQHAPPPVPRTHSLAPTRCPTL